jgi:hypothetical protein
MEALKRLSLAFAVVALGGIGCGDDDDTKPSGTLDASLDSMVPSTDGGGDAGLACTSYTPVSGNMCGGSHCLETLAELTSEKSSTAACSKPEELSQFCQLTSVQAVSACVVPAALSGATGDALTAAVTMCAMPKLPDYSAGCLDCFVKSATCAAANCLNECAANPNTVACDTCRVTRGCIGQFYTCSGLKNPLL